MSLTVAVAGMGAIGFHVARVLDDGIPGLKLVAVASRDRAKVEGQMSDFAAPPAVCDVGELPDHADVIVEAAPASVFDAIADPAVRAGRLFIPSSVGQLLRREDLGPLAAQTGARIIIPTGALLGLDAVRAAAEGNIQSVTIETRKPPGGLAGAPYLIENDINVVGLNGPVRVFKGTARDGARGFPANVNVAAALSLAGIGADKTMLEIWADPEVTRNTHTIRLEADSVRLTMKIENVPSEENLKTGKLTPLSVIATLRGLVSPIKVGT
jgi:aspartate dehydrogenase